MTEKLLTIIVPVYNVQQYLKNCLDSFLVKEQEYLEVLVVDDGSTDDCYKIAADYMKKYPRVFRVIHKENEGHGSALNTGIRHANGKYLKTVDGDDWVQKDGLDELLNVLKTAEADIVVTNYMTFNNVTQKEALSRERWCREFVANRLYFIEEVGNMFFVKMHSMTIKTEIMKQIPFAIDEHCYYVDSEYVMFPIAFAKTLAFYDVVVYMYRVGQRNQSVNIKQMAKNKDQHLKVLNRLLEYYDWAMQRGVTKGQQAYLEHGIALIWKSQFKVFLSCEYSDELLNEVIACDQLVQTQYPEIAKCLKSKAVKGIRLFDYRMFRLVNRCFGLLYAVFYRM